MSFLQATLKLAIVLTSIDTSTCSSSANDIQMTSSTYTTVKQLDSGETITITCEKCPPGTHMTEECEEDFGNSSCVSCPAGTFSSIHNRAKRCEKCSSSCKDENQFQTTNCTEMQNIKCKCKTGFRWIWTSKSLRIGYCKAIHQSTGSNLTVAIGSNTGGHDDKNRYLTVTSKVKEVDKRNEKSRGNRFQPLSFLASIIITVASLHL